MVSVLASGSSSSGLNPGWGYCVVFLGKTLYPYIPLPIQEYKWIPQNAMLDRNPVMD